MAFSPTKQQQAAIEHTKGPLLIIAGPGSGKTFTLVERIIHLIIDKGIPPEQILVATFTEKAAAELISRITHRLLVQNIVVNINEMYIGTLHSICLRLLEEYREFTPLKKNFAILDQFDQTYRLYQNVQRFDALSPLASLCVKKLPSMWDKASTLAAWMNKLSEEMIDVARLLEDTDENIVALGKFYKEYRSFLSDENLLDFSLIQRMTVEMLQAYPDEVLLPLHEKIQYIMIDEYQDTNTVQEALVFLLAGERQNICVVGDDDQGLYRFRGATIRNILEFPGRFQNACTQKTLTVNYRSDPTIINFYNQWIEQEEWSDGEKQFRFDKSIIPPEGKVGNTNSIIRVSGKDSGHGDISPWLSEVFDFLQYMKAHHLEDWNQIAFLFSSVRNDKVKSLVQFLEENNIPVYAPRSDLFFEREEIRLMIGAFLFICKIYQEVREKWTYGTNKIQALWDYYDYCLQLFAAELRKSENIELREWALLRVRELDNMLINNRTLDWGFASMFYDLLQFPLFSKFLHKASGTERAARNLALLSQLLVKFEYLHHILFMHPKFYEKNVSGLFHSFFRFIIDGGMNEFEDGADFAPCGCVSVMTIHQSKGLEFPVAIVGSLDKVPRKSYTELDEILQNSYYQRRPFEPMQQIKNYDFRRLFYTAFSRAKNLLVLTCQEHSSKGQGKRNVPSKYFTNFYNELPTWREADLASLQYDSVNIAKQKKQYSYTSHILVYEACPRQYQFFKFWEFVPIRQGGMIFGTLVHQTIEDIHKSVLLGHPEKITEDNIKAWFHINYINLSQRERVYLAPLVKEIALSHVLNYVNRKNQDWSDIVDTEVDVSLVKEEYILMGKIDLIQGRDHTVEIVDFKSEKKPDQFTDKEKLRRYQRQLEIYAHIVEERYGVEVSALNLYYTGETDGIPLYSFPYKKSSIENTIIEVDRVVSCMERQEFSIVPYEVKKKLCRECELKSYCERANNV